MDPIEVIDLEDIEIKEPYTSPISDEELNLPQCPICLEENPFPGTEPLARSSYLRHHLILRHENLYARWLTTRWYQREEKEPKIEAKTEVESERSSTPSTVVLGEVKEEVKEEPAQPEVYASLEEMRRARANQASKASASVSRRKSGTTLGDLMGLSGD